MNKKIITIAGKLGSGKSTTSRKVAEMLKMNHFSSGDFLRKVAHDRGMSIKDLMIAAESDPQIDYDIDEILKGKADEDNTIIDSRLAFHWIPDSFKVFLEIDPDIAAGRMFYDLGSNEARKESENAKNIESMKHDMVERHNSDKKRYQKLYGVDHTDHKNFDLVINTGLPENDIETVVKKIISEYLKVCIDC